MKSALVTGVNGQDGSYMAELLINQGYKVYGVTRPTSKMDFNNLSQILNDENQKKYFELIFSDLLDYNSISRVIYEAKPNFIFNFAAQSNVYDSFKLPHYTFQVNTLAFLNILESVKLFSLDSVIYQAGSSEEFGNSEEVQTLNTDFDPQSPYALSKLSSHALTNMYQKDIQVKHGILFNHESYRRGPKFVTKKIVSAANLIKKKLTTNGFEIGEMKLKLGYLDSKRDWGWAPEYMIGIFEFLNNDKLDKLLIGTGSSTTVKEFALRVFDNFNLKLDEYLEIDTRLMRPNEVFHLRADKETVAECLSWVPKIDWKQLCDLMCEQEMQGHEDPVKWKSLLENRR